MTENLAPDVPWPEREPDWRHDAPDPPESFPVPWSWADGATLVLWTIVAQALVAIPFTVAGVDVLEGLGTFTYLIVAQLVTLAGTLLWLRARDALSWRLLGPVRPAGRHGWIGLGIGLSGYLTVTLLILLATAAFGPFDPPDQPILQRSTEDVPSFVLGVVAAVVLAPIVEELVFRGVLFQALRHRAGLWPAIGISSIVFGLVHLQAPLYAIALTILGFWLAAAFHRTGSLVVPVVAHALFNAIALILAGAFT